MSPSSEHKVWIRAWQNDRFEKLMQEINTIYNRRHNNAQKQQDKNPTDIPLPEDDSNEESESSTEQINVQNNKRKKKHQPKVKEQNKIIIHTSNRFSALTEEAESENDPMDASDENKEEKQGNAQTNTQ